MNLHILDLIVKSLLSNTVKVSHAKVYGGLVKNQPNAAEADPFDNARQEANCEGMLILGDKCHT